MDAKTPAIFLDLDNPLQSAKIFRERVRPYLIKQNGIWYDYAGTHYKEIEGATIKSAVQTWMASTFIPNEAGKLIPLVAQPYDIRHVVEMLENLPQVHKPAATYKSPCWLNDDTSNPRAIIPCLNGLLDIETRTLRPHTPDFFCVYCLGLEFKPYVRVPEAWLTFLDQTYNGRQHLIDALQEAFGSIISGDRSHEKIFYHIGRVRSGKGVVQTVSRHLVGEKNTVSFSFGGNESTLGDKHGLAGAESALLIQIPDISVGSRASRGACTRLKEISGGDPVPVRPLYARATTMILPGVIQGGSNGIPNFGTDADALAARLLFWDHRNHVEADKRDLTLKDPRKSKLLSVEALTGILNWSLTGLDRLNARGYFEEWQESRDIKRLMLRESNPIVAFLDAHCEWGAVTVETTVLHHVYRDYCAGQGIGYKIENHFGQALRLAAQNLGIVLDMHQPRTEGGRIREWSGVGLNAANLVEYHEHDPDAVEIAGGPSIETLATDARGRLIPRPWQPPEGERDYSHAFDDGGEDD
jgi:putative DNA primase/helicase